MTWTSSAASVATVSASGLVTGVAFGSAVIEASCEGIKAQAAVTVTLVGNVLREGTVTLPTGVQVTLASLTIQNTWGTVSPQANGRFSLPSPSSGPELAAAFAGGSRPVLLGWLDDAHTTLTTRTTAEVLAWFDLGGPLLPSVAQDFVRQELSRRSELNALETAIKNAIAGNPASITLDVAAVQQARHQVQITLVPPALAGLRQNSASRQNIVQFDPLGAKSGLVLREVDLNTIAITNQYRRRAVALLDRTGYLPASGAENTAKARIKTFELPATYGITTLAGGLTDVVLGNLAWAERETPPVGVPVVPADAQWTKYRVTALGLGLVPDELYAQLSAADKEELLLVEGKAIVLDFVLPFVANLVVEANAEKINKSLESAVGANAIKDLLDLLLKEVPEMFEMAHRGETRAAVRELVSKMGSKLVVQKAIFELVAVIGSELYVLVNPTVNPGSLRGPVSEFGEKLSKFVGAVDAVVTTFDICLESWQVGSSRGIEVWDLTVRPSKVKINPPESKIGKGDIQLLKATVLGLGELAPGASLEYRWTTTGAHGNLYDADNDKKTLIVSSRDAVTYTPDGKSTGQDQVTVQITRKQAGTTPVVIGQGTATVEVGDPAISLTPDDVSLRGGDKQTFTVNVPASLKGTATLSYRWSTTGDFGSLDRGSRSFESASNQAVYTARSQTRGEDEVSVEVWATNFVPPRSLGTDRARVKVERTPFNLLPATVRASKDTTVRFIARPNGDLPPGVKYAWTFGDGSATVVLNDSVTTHRFATQGTYRVSVEMQEAATGRRLAVTGGTVTIGFSVTLVPNSANLTVSTPLDLTASLAGPPVAPLRYWWDFGDGGTLRKDDDNTARHSWSRAGTFTVTVLLEDPATGVDLATATGTVTVKDDTDAPVWRITEATLVSLSGDIPHDSMSKHPSFAAYGTYFREKQALSDIDAGRTTAYVHALGGVSLPDCFDFDNDNNKAEMLTWPAWIWIQFPSQITSGCGGDKVLGHSPFYPSWDLGFDQSGFFRQFQNADIRFDYPAPLFATISLNPGSGSLSGRGLSEWVCCTPIPGTPGASLANVYAVHEVAGTITGRTLSGQITLIYTLPPAGGIPRRTWKAVYSFEAEQGR